MVPFPLVGEGTMWRAPSHLTHCALCSERCARLNAFAEQARPRNDEWRKSLANKSVGVVGLGLMGEVFARRLLDGGQSVIGYDIDVAKGVRLADMGGQAAASIADVARACDPIVLAVFDTSQVEDVVE